MGLESHLYLGFDPFHCAAVQGTLAAEAAPHTLHVANLRWRCFLLARVLSTGASKLCGEPKTGRIIIAARLHAHSFSLSLLFIHNFLFVQSEVTLSFRRHLHLHGLNCSFGERLGPNRV